MENKEFTHIGKDIPELDGAEYRAFFTALKTAVLRSLEDRGLITHGQAERCREMTEAEEYA